MVGAAGVCGTNCSHFSSLLEGIHMKKILLILPVLLMLAACTAQPASTLDAAVAAVVNATLTAMTQSPPQLTASSTPEQQPTATQTPLQTAGCCATPSPEASAPGLSDDQLRNGVYTSPDWGKFQLSDGIYYRTPPNSQESSETYTTRLLDTILHGDLDLDGSEDAVVFLATQSGGTGHFVEMAAVLNLNGNASSDSMVYLGDRVVVEAGKIQDGVITLNMRVQGPNDGMCCPSQSVTWTFRLEHGRLVKIS